MASKKESFFLVIEGLDGSGKSSVARWIVETLKATLGNNVKLTFQPHDPSCAGLFIRQILMEKIRHISPNTVALAFAVNRADHYDREIFPFLNQTNGSKRVVVCDRYYLSSLVYQSDSELSISKIMDLNAGVQKPDLTIFLSASNRTCYERMRKRQEDKELFEKNLNQTRDKYRQAIKFLVERGEKIIEIDAEGTIPEVTKKVLSALVENSPNWLSMQYSLPTELSPPVFESSNITIKEVSSRFKEDWSQGPIINRDQLLQILNSMQDKISNVVWNMSFNDVATLFLDAIRCSGYSILDKLAWTDLDAFKLEYTMPLGMTQHGTALLLGETQRYDIIIKKLLEHKRIKTLGRMSDFLFLFDSNPSHLRNEHYERDLVEYVDSLFLSPSTTVVGRPEVANAIFASGLEDFKDEYFNTLTSSELLKETFWEFVKQNIPEKKLV